ncbi:MAG: cell division protein ZapA [Sphingomonas sp.]|nr:cell division protein ZapA [Sphingomonas sp.]
MKAAGNGSRIVAYTVPTEYVTIPGLDVRGIAHCGFEPRQTQQAWSAGEMLDQRWAPANRASGGLNAERTMLLVALMLADSLYAAEHRPATGGGPSASLRSAAFASPRDVRVPWAGGVVGGSALPIRLAMTLHWHVRPLTFSMTSISFRTEQ